MENLQDGKHVVLEVDDDDTIVVRRRHPSTTQTRADMLSSLGPKVMGTVATVNLSEQLSNDQLQTMINAVKVQADRDIAPIWGYSVNFFMVPKGRHPPRADWYMVVADTIDVANAAGYHDQGRNGEPIIKIDVSAGTPNVTISHEIVESISDTNANTTIKGYDEKGKPCLYYRESADPVEEDTYQVNGIGVSDFITPLWFVNNSPGPWDHLGVLNKPYEIRQGGYMELSYDMGKTWTEVDKFSKRAKQHRAKHSRWQLYKTPLEKRKESTFTVDESKDVRVNKVHHP